MPSSVGCVSRRWSEPLVLQAIAPADDLKSALDKLETDLDAGRRKALSA